MNRSASVSVITVLVFAVLMNALGACASDERSIDLNEASQSELEAEKLRAEIRQLDSETDRDLLDWAPIFTVFVAVTGVFVTITRQIGERASDREQRKIDARQELDERFATAVDRLGSERTAIQVGAAVSLRAFLRDDDDFYYDDVYGVVLANLKLEHDSAVRDELVQTFETGIRRRLAALEKGDEFHVNLARADLVRVDLSGLDLGRSADLGFAKLNHADLTAAKLEGARGFGAVLDGAVLSRTDMRVARFNEASGLRVFFHEADLKSAHFKDAKLPQARFFKAKLQASHFERADLRGAKFEESDVNDTYFTGATLDDAALRSLGRAFNWKKAHLDPQHEARLKDLLRTASQPTVH